MFAGINLKRKYQPSLLLSTALWPVASRCAGDVSIPRFRIFFGFVYCAPNSSWSSKQPHAP